MYIAYVYIEEFEGLKDVELCLSNRYVIKKESFEAGRLILGVRDNPEFIEGFWEGVSKDGPDGLAPRQGLPNAFSRIGNVSTIVGRNGSGKTRILQLLWSIATNSSKLSRSKVFALMHNEDDSWFVAISSYEIEFEWYSGEPSAGSHPFLLVESADFVFLPKGFGHIPGDGNYCFPVYYSPIFLSEDSFKSAFGRDGHGANVSISERFFNFLQKYASLYSILDAGSIRLNFRDKEFKDQLTFLSQVSRAKHGKFPIPNDVICIFSPFRSDHKYGLYWKKRNRTKRVKLYEKIFTFFRDGYHSISSYYTVQQGNVELQGGLIRCCFMLDYLKYLMYDEWILFDYILKRIPQNLTQDLLKYQEELWQFLLNLNLPGTDMLSWSKSVQKVEAILVGRAGVIWPKITASPEFRVIQFRVPTDVVIDLVEHLQKLRVPNWGQVKYGETSVEKISTNDFFDAPLTFLPSSSLSSGHQLMLALVTNVVAGIRAVSANLNTSMYFAKSISRYDSSGTISRGKHSVLLLIDEGESGLHPQYQIDFINDLLNLLTPLLPDNIELQIVFSTHSPLILSDFPGSSVVLLGGAKKEDFATFGANVHSLLKDEFFLDSTIGAFAQSKINQWIDRIDNEIVRGDNLQLLKTALEIQKGINMIGDPYLKNQLFSYLDTKLFRIESMTVLQQIRESRNNAQN